MSFPPAVLQLAEDLNAFAPMRPGCERVVTDRYVLTMDPEAGAHGTVVQRLRLGERVDLAVLRAVLDDARAHIRAAGRDQATWEVGPSSTPREGLVDALRAAGLRPHAQISTAVGMVLAAPPQLRARDDVRVWRVRTLDDQRRARRLFHRVFEAGQPEPADFEARVQEEFKRDGDGTLNRTYLAALKGSEEPIAAAAAMLVREAGALICCGGVSLPEARGRGAYQALVQARWDEAKAEGLTHLITQAGPLSEPILAAAGFQPVARLTILEDRLG